MPENKKTVEEQPKKTTFLKRDVNEQLRYLRDFFGWMTLEINGEDALKPHFLRHARRKNMSYEDAEASMAEEVAERKQAFSDRIAEFEAKLAEDPERYPLGSLFIEVKLNAFERFVVTALAAASMFTRGAIYSIDVRTLAGLCHSSDLKRLDAEMYFLGKPKLQRLGIIALEPDEHCRQLHDKDLYLAKAAYASILGRELQAVDEDEHGGPRRFGQRHHSPGGARTLGELVEPSMGMHSVALDPATQKQVDMALCQAQSGALIFDQWGLGKQVTKGTGATLLFSGPPGTGKTHTAEAFAAALGKKLLFVRSADLVSPWHGEDERHSAEVFKRAEEEDAVLLLDEADSFLYSRHEVARSTDISSNRTVNVFLSCLESATVPVILTTNRANSLDEALERRISMKVIFEPPGEAERQKIWKLHLPRKLPRARDVNIRELAMRYPLTGGQIKNAVVAAARAAIHRASGDETECRVTMADLEGACAEELEGSRVFGTAERQIGFRT